jgi:hypothetical protein
MLSDAEVVELAALRRRAYSAQADIARDPSALARLVHLEAAARPTSPSTAAPKSSAGAADRESDTAEASRSDPPPVVERHPAPSGDGADAAGSRDGVATSTDAAPDAPTASADAPPTHPRRSWPARVVVGAAVPVAAILLVGGFAVGSGAWSPLASDPTPSPTPTATNPDVQRRPGFANSYAWARFVRHWDTESLRVLARLDGTRIWSGTIADGATTCVAIDDQITDPVACADTTMAGSDGIVIEAPRSRDDDTTGFVYVVNPYGDPVVMVERIPPDGAE